MTSPIDRWYARKLNGRLKRLKAPCRTTQEFVRHAGLGKYAKLTISAEPADSFSFCSDAAWATEADREEFEPYVLDGILDLLMVGPSDPILGVRIVLESAITRPVESNGASFYLAARAATQEIIGITKEWPHNSELVNK